MVFLALKQSIDIGRDAEAERALLIKLLDRFGSKYPQPDATHYSGALGKHYLKWEQHNEFLTYTLFCEGPLSWPSAITPFRWQDI